MINVRHPTRVLHSFSVKNIFFMIMYFKGILMQSEILLTFSSLHKNNVPEVTPFIF